MKIVSVDKVYLFPDHIKELQKYGEVVVYKNVPTEKEGIERIKEADIVVDNWFDMPSQVIAGAKKLKMIAVAATGYEWVDLKEAKKRNIIVCNSPGFSTEAVAEHTFGLLLDAIRKASMAQRDLRNKKYDPIIYVGKELKGKILGVIGYGKIGKRVAEIAKSAFGMEILFANSSTSREYLEKLLKESDIISINTPLNEKTRGLLGKKEFYLMKKGVVVVNTGRGAIIDEEAFAYSLKSGKIFAAGLDVLSTEPMDMKSPLFSYSNVVITPHIAFNTEESKFRVSRIVTDNILKFIQDHPQNVVS